MAPITPTPSSGEMATPVICERVLAISTPGCGSLGAGAFFSSARAVVGDKIPARTASVTMRKTSLFMAQTFRLFVPAVKWIYPAPC